MKCYLCKSEKWSRRQGSVRDRADLGVVECDQCGLVTLTSLAHIADGHYEASGMHADKLPTMEEWLRRSELDDQRRIEMLRTVMIDKHVLDFGCGAGGFISKASTAVASIAGVEPEARVRAHWKDKVTIYADLSLVDRKYDLITAFHVIEHLIDPRSILQRLSDLLSVNGRIVVEVPSSEDALLTLYENESFRNFTYWSQHLYLFNPHTLALLAKQSGLKIISLKQYQRYPLSNHLFWLSRNKPGGHQIWNFLNSEKLNSAYSSALASIGKCDTLIAYLEK